MSYKINKSGLSAIVSSVLFILIILVAIGMIWFFVRPLIVQASEESANSAQCLEVQISPVECRYSQNFAIVKVKRGTDNVNISGLDFIVDSSGKIERIKWEDRRTDIPGILNSTPNSLETLSYVIQKSSSFDNSSRVGVAAKIGKNKLCNVNSGEISCLPNSALYTCGDFDQNGGVEGQDIEAFYSAFESGNMIADLNGDLRLDQQDVLIFWSSWSNSIEGPCHP